MLSWFMNEGKNAEGQQHKIESSLLMNEDY